MTQLPEEVRPAAAAAACRRSRRALLLVGGAAHCDATSRPRPAACVRTWPQVGWLYYRAFVRTMRREWAGIDHLRLDKFLMLVRKFFAALLRQLQAHAW